MNGWLNIYKPVGISSARAVAYVKKVFKNCKVGHTGTLDLEAQGVLPVALGEATKLTGVLIDAKKQYKFIIKFGAKTDTADSAGTVMQRVDYIPTGPECINICDRFIGEIKQMPPAYSALKINGRRAYDLARAGREVILKERNIFIYSLECIDYSAEDGTASYICECSKGTYIRTLAEDISLALQSLGYVIELCRLKVGMFDVKDSVDVSSFTADTKEAEMLLKNNCLRVESILDDIPVLEASDLQVQQIRFGRPCRFEDAADLEFVWIRNEGNIIAIGSLHSNDFKSSRVFNL